MRALLLVAVAVVLLGSPAAAAPAAPPSRVLRLDGIGPLTLGMTRPTATATGWLAHRSGGCELGGPPLPVDYRLDGAHAPSGLRGAAEFQDGRLRSIVVSRGVRTAAGVRPGHTTVARMVARYRALGFHATARHDATFEGTFVTVRRRAGGRQVLGAFASGSVVDTIGIPFVPVCE